TRGRKGNSRAPTRGRQREIASSETSCGSSPGMRDPTSSLLGERRAGAEDRDDSSVRGDSHRQRPALLVDHEAEGSSALESLEKDLAPFADEVANRRRAVLAARLRRREHLVLQVHLEKLGNVQVRGNVDDALPVVVAVHRGDGGAEKQV